MSAHRPRIHCGHRERKCIRTSARQQPRDKSGSVGDAQLPNELWQADTTHWMLEGGSDVEILQGERILDDSAERIMACRVIAPADRA